MSKGPGRHRPGPFCLERDGEIEMELRNSDQHRPASTINWKLIAFIGALWWFIYSAPTEDSLFTMFVHKAGGTSASDDF